jgi:hypothetical protein
MESSIMARSDGDPLQVVLLKVVPESLSLGERLRLPKQSAMDSRLPKQMVSQREKAPQVRHSLSVVAASADE